jgi:HEAT repeat protein
MEREPSFMTLSISLETLRQDHAVFDAVSKRSLFVGSPSVSVTEMVDLLIASLEDVDKSAAERTEALLTRIGRPAIASLIQGLRSPHLRVRSVCAMVLIRLGQPVLDDLRDCYAHSQHLPKVRWIVEYIFHELGDQPLNQPVSLGKSRNVVPFAKMASEQPA